MDQLEKVIELTGKPNEVDLRPISSSSPFASQMLGSLNGIRQLPATSFLFMLKIPAEAKPLTLSLLNFNPDKRPSAELALANAFLDKFYHQEAEPLCDKVIRLPIADGTKMKVNDYRAQIFELIHQRKKQAQEEANLNSGRQWESSPASSGRGNLRDRAPSSPPSPGLGNAMDASPWSHQGGASAPPSTPKA
eukprot:TRINITY_DN28372_c0_g1_i1.p1 TRINITY_DN28372_c0_g1~~TRINITY_DN28372_c0_g1_i1.p1  ORF type:complete len:217 (-),score=39.13 TRINITY_DN28372_c0_g1_i1:278-853(-)